MVRNYVRKTKKSDDYTKEELLMAKEAIIGKQMTVSFASKFYKIPRTTLYDHLIGRRGVKSTTMGYYGKNGFIS